MSSNTKNYHAHGGNEWVVGGKLTFLPGAKVEGLDELLQGQGSSVVQIPYIQDSEATTVAAMRTEHNALLAALRDAGLMAPAPDES